MAEQLSAELSALYKSLLIADVSELLPGGAPQSQVSLSDQELIRLVGAASRLALSTDASDKTIAYEIATRIVQLRRLSSEAFISAAELILARLGNFPGRQLLQSRYAR